MEKRRNIKTGPYISLFYSFKGMPWSSLSLSKAIATYMTALRAEILDMAKDHLSQQDYVVEEEDYIDMDINSTSLLCCTLPSPPHPREFEFHMSSSHFERDDIASPADELFYKGNLLPLHLPPRLQMVEKLLQSSKSTPFESCNVSPATSCYVSAELNPEDLDYYLDLIPKEVDVEPNTKRSTRWSKKLKLIKQASKAYLKSIFIKSGCDSDVTSAVPKAKECSNGGYSIARSEKKKEKIPKKSPLQNGHRRSFSGIVSKRRYADKSSSSSSSASSSCSSSNSSSFSSMNSMLKRSSSVHSDKEGSIQGAIAYCKKSQQQQEQILSDVEFYLFSESTTDRAICEEARKARMFKG